ncbi:MAG: putative exported protein [Proteobacteria bacterium]|nr:putative exported protein [Pseudomonadota bacterium]
MRCHLCDSENAIDAVFCVSCGNRLGSSPQNLDTAQPQMAAPVVQSSSKLWIILGGVAAGTVATAATMGGAWLYLKDKPAGNEATEPQTIVSQTTTSLPQPLNLPSSANESATMPETTTQTAQSEDAEKVLPPKVLATSPQPLRSSYAPPVEAYPASLDNDDEGDFPPPPFELSTPPDFYVVPSEDNYVYMAAALTGLYFLAGEWYRYQNGHWFRSDSYNGSWRKLDRARVPQSILNTPPDYPRYLGKNYQRIPFYDISRNWQSWDRHRHWNSYDWYRQEASPEVRSERRRSIDGGRRNQSNDQQTRPGVRPSSSQMVIPLVSQPTPSAQSGIRPDGRSGRPGQHGGHPPQSQTVAPAQPHVVQPQTTRPIAIQTTPITTQPAAVLPPPTVQPGTGTRPDGRSGRPGHQGGRPPQGQTVAPVQPQAVQPHTIRPVTVQTTPATTQPAVIRPPQVMSQAQPVRPVTVQTTPTTTQPATVVHPGTRPDGRSGRPPQGQTVAPAQPQVVQPQIIRPVTVQTTPATTQPVVIRSLQVIPQVQPVRPTTVQMAPTTTRPPVVRPPLPPVATPVKPPSLPPQPKQPAQVKPLTPENP